MKKKLMKLTVSSSYLAKSNNHSTKKFLALVTCTFFFRLPS